MNEHRTCDTGGTNLTQPRSSPVRGYVYFIGCGEHIKIGFSTRPLDRLRALQTSHPDALEILGTMKGTRSLEAKLHERFGDLRERGEWFRAADVLWDYIDKHAIERKGALPDLPPEARAMVGRLTRLRDVYDPDSATGHTCSNLVEQITAMVNYDRPEWASHEIQTLPWMIKQQMKHLAESMDAQN